MKQREKQTSVNLTYSRNIVGVQFRRSGKIYDFSSEGLSVIVGDHVIVDSDRGPSLAEVVSVRFHHPKEHFEKKLKPSIDSKNYQHKKLSYI